MTQDWIEAMQESLIDKCLPVILPGVRRPTTEICCYQQWRRGEGDSLHRLVCLQGFCTPAVLRPMARLPYPQFVNTDYWRTICEALAGFPDRAKCRECGIHGVPLQVHHKRYRNRGREVHFIDRDLELRCIACHREFHRCWKMRSGNVGTWISDEPDVDCRRIVNQALALAQSGATFQSSH